MGTYRASDYIGEWQLGDYGYYINDHKSEFIFYLHLPAHVAECWAGVKSCDWLNKKFIIVEVEEQVLAIYRHDDWYTLYHLI